MVFSNVAVIIPTLNEEQGIKPTILEMKHVLKNSDFIIIDGGSKDRTVEIAKDLNVNIIIQKGKGKGDAIREGLQEIKTKTKYVIFNDGDFTYPAEKLKDMMLILNKNPKVGMVLGDRYKKKIKTKNLLDPYFIGNRFLAFSQKIMNDVTLNDPLTGLRIIRHSLLKTWIPKSNSFDIEAEINSHIEKMDYEIVEVPIKYRKRMGNKKLGLKHGFKILKRIIKESLTE